MLQQQQQQGMVPNSTSSRPSSAQAYACADKGWSISTHNSDSGIGGSSSSSNGSPGRGETGSPPYRQQGSSKLQSPALAPATPSGVSAAARPGSLAGAADAPSGAAVAASTAAKTAYQAYEERAVEAGSKKDGPGKVLLYQQQCVCVLPNHVMMHPCAIVGCAVVHPGDVGSSSSAC
jgi:hypothetical protein